MAKKETPHIRREILLSVPQLQRNLGLPTRYLIPRRREHPPHNRPPHNLYRYRPDSGYGVQLQYRPILPRRKDTGAVLAGDSWLFLPPELPLPPLQVPQ